MANGITRKDAVREALNSLGKDASRSDIQKHVKDKHGFEMTLDHISNCKGEIQKEKGTKKPVVAKHATVQKQEPKKTTLAGIDLKDIETVKELVERVGAASLKRLIDVMAR